MWYGYLKYLHISECSLLTCIEIRFFARCSIILLLILLHLNQADEQKHKALTIRIAFQIARKLQRSNYVFRAVARTLIGGGGSVYSYIRVLPD